MRAAALARELDIVKTNNKQLTSQVQQLQELLATREQQHKFVKVIPLNQTIGKKTCFLHYQLFRSLFLELKWKVLFVQTVEI